MDQEIKNQIGTIISLIRAKQVVEAQTALDEMIQEAPEMTGQWFILAKLLLVGGKARQESIHDSLAVYGVAPQRLFQEAMRILDAPLDSSNNGPSGSADDAEDAAADAAPMDSTRVAAVETTIGVDEEATAETPAGSSKEADKEPSEDTTAESTIESTSDPIAAATDGSTVEATIETPPDPLPTALSDPQLEKLESLLSAIQQYGRGRASEGVSRRDQKPNQQKLNELNGLLGRLRRHNHLRELDLPPPKIRRLNRLADRFARIHPPEQTIDPKVDRLRRFQKTLNTRLRTSASQVV